MADDPAFAYLERLVDEMINRLPPAARPAFVEDIPLLARAAKQLRRLEIAARERAFHFEEHARALANVQKVRARRARAALEREAYEGKAVHLFSRTGKQTIEQLPLSGKPSFKGLPGSARVILDYMDMSDETQIAAVTWAQFKVLYNEVAQVQPDMPALVGPVRRAIVTRLNYLRSRKHKQLRNSLGYNETTGYGPSHHV